MNRTQIALSLWISVLLLAPGAFAQLPEVSIDLDRNAAGVQTELDKSTLTPGGTIQGAVYMVGNAGITYVQGFDIRVLVSPTSGIAAGSSTSGVASEFGTGVDATDPTNGYFGRKWIHTIPAFKINLPGEVFLFDLVLPNPLPAGDIELSFPTTTTRPQQGIQGDLVNGPSLDFSIDDMTMQTASIVESGSPEPTDTPTDTPPIGATDTPTDTPVTETPTDTPTFTPTDTPPIGATDTPTDTPVTPSPTEAMGYVLLDGYGAQHLQGTAVALMPDFNNENEFFPWYGFDIARDIEFLADHTTRLVLNGYGQIATVVLGATTTYDNTLLDIQDDKYVSMKPSASGDGAYVLDKYGEVTILGDANPALGGIITGSLLPGGGVDEVSEELKLRAVDLEVNADEDTVYVLDSFGGVHIVGANAAERGAMTRAYFGWDIARDLEFFTANELDCVLDGLGGVHPVSGEALPPEYTGSIPGTVEMSYHYFGWDIARDIEFTPDFKSAWKLDGLGAAHNCGLAPIVPGIWFGWDIAEDLEIYLAETPF